MAGHARLDLVKHRHGRAYLTGRAIAALKCIMPDKGRLHGMKILRRPQTFDRGDAVVPVHDGQSEAGIDPPAIDNHGTGTALAMRSEEHTSELQSLMRYTYAVFCLKKNTHT